MILFQTENSVPIFIAIWLEICLGMKLRQDVAGASVMAAAVACPELFVNILATFFTEGDVGIGTVVGTGLFNILLVPGLCVLMANEKVPSYFLI